MSMVIKSPLAAQSMDARMKVGKQDEADIIRELRAKGLTVTDVTARQDMYDKIDARVLVNDAAIAAFPVFGQFSEFKGQYLPVQIKARQDKYPDFEYEYRTDRYAPAGQGREAKSKASIMFCRSLGSIAAASMPALKRLAAQLYCKHEAEFTTDAPFTYTRPDGMACMKRVQDQRDGFYKTILYVKKG
jgi:hypothetical protein